MTDAKLLLLRPDTTHVVVLFNSSDNAKKNKRQIDLLPRSWLSVENEKWFCYYPEKDMYSQVEQWSKENIEPDEQWTNYEVEILKEARSYNQGLRQLEKSNSEDETETSSQCESADENDQNTYNDNESNIIDQLLKFNANSSRQVLADIPSFSQLAANNNLQDDIDSISPSLRPSKKRTFSENSSDSSTSSSKRAKESSDMETNDSTCSMNQNTDTQTQSLFDTTSVSTDKEVYNSDDDNSSSSSLTDFEGETQRGNLPFETVSVVMESKDTDDSNLNPPSTPNEKAKIKTRSKSCDPTSRKNKKIDDFDIFAPSTSTQGMTRTKTRRMSRKTKNEEESDVRAVKPLPPPTIHMRTRSKSVKPSSIAKNIQPETEEVKATAPKVETRGRKRNRTPSVARKKRKYVKSNAIDMDSSTKSVTPVRKRGKSVSAEAMTVSAESMTSKETFYSNARDRSCQSVRSSVSTASRKYGKRKTLPCNCPSWNHVLDEIRKFEHAIEIKFESLKNSLLQEFYTKINNIQNRVSSGGIIGIHDAFLNRDLLPPLPVNTLEGFLSLEKQLYEDPEVAGAFKSYLLMHLNNIENLHTGMKMILPLIIMKRVQLLYSAFGRKTKRSNKMNFSTTQTYQVLKEIFLHKFYQNSLKDFNSYLSRWLSNAGDREGGKMERTRRYTEGDLSQTRIHEV